MSGIHDDYLARTGPALVTDQPDCTFYQALDSIQEEPRGYFRVFIKLDDYDVETRIPYTRLWELGWRKLP